MNKTTCIFCGENLIHSKEYSILFCNSRREDHEYSFYIYENKSYGSFKLKYLIYRTVSKSYIRSYPSLNIKAYKTYDYYVDDEKIIADLDTIMLLS